MAVSFLLNLGLFATMEEGKTSKSINDTASTAMVCCFIPLLIESVNIVFRRAYRTSLAALERPSESEPNFSITSNDALNRDPTDGGIINAFV